MKTFALLKYNNLFLAESDKCCKFVTGYLVNGAVLMQMDETLLGKNAVQFDIKSHQYQNL